MNSKEKSVPFYNLFLKLFKFHKIIFIKVKSPKQPY